MDEYNQLLKQLNRGDVGNSLLNSAAWDVIKKIAKGIETACMHQLKTVDPIRQPTRIIRLQEKALLYGDFVQNLATTLHLEGKAAFELMSEMGLEKHLFTSVAPPEEE